MFELSDGTRVIKMTYAGASLLTDERLQYHIGRTYSVAASFDESIDEVEIMLEYARKCKEGWQDLYLREQGQSRWLDLEQHNYVEEELVDLKEEYQLAKERQLEMWQTMMTVLRARQSAPALPVV